VQTGEEEETLLTLEKAMPLLFKKHRAQKQKELCVLKRKAKGFAF
jgi:hypothetical protein